MTIEGNTCLALGLTFFSFMLVLIFVTPFDNFLAKEGLAQLYSFLTLALFAFWSILLIAGGFALDIKVK
ncbi:MAG: hypothetical protein ACYC7D_10400 [Nitrososphaerales archaeon]